MAHAMARDGGLTWLDSADDRGRWSILAARPRQVVVARVGRGGWLRIGRRWQRLRGDPLDAVARRLAALDPVGPPDLPFRAGAIGYLGYGLRRLWEPLPGHARPDPLPDLWLGIHERALLFDHERATWTATGRWQPGHLARLLSAPTPPAAPSPPRAQLTPDRSRAAYLAGVTRALEEIGRGNAYQVNVTGRWTAPVVESAWTLYRRLRKLNPAPFGAYLDLGGGRSVISASPERFLALRGDVVETRPIKGTRPRSEDAAEDARLADELRASDKDRAELAMIVDLLRNDLGRVARYGSVRVGERQALRSHPAVHHLEATVEARLATGRDWTDLVRATFPGGSVTGAPKLSAMQIIAELEPFERGVYTGAIGYVDAGGDLDLSVVIRTLVVDRGRAWLNAGGGIVADSDPAAEYAEALDKARPLAKALGAQL